MHGRHAEPGHLDDHGRTAPYTLTVAGRPWTPTRRAPVTCGALPDYGIWLPVTQAPGHDHGHRDRRHRRARDGQRRLHDRAAAPGAPTGCALDAWQPCPALRRANGLAVSLSGRRRHQLRRLHVMALPGRPSRARRSAGGRAGRDRARRRPADAVHMATTDIAGDGHGRHRHRAHRQTADWRHYRSGEDSRLAAGWGDVMSYVHRMPPRMRVRFRNRFPRHPRRGPHAARARPQACGQRHARHHHRDDRRDRGRQLAFRLDGRQTSMRACWPGASTPHLMRRPHRLTALS